MNFPVTSTLPHPDKRPSFQNLFVSLSSSEPPTFERQVSRDKIVELMRSSGVEIRVLQQIWRSCVNHNSSLSSDEFFRVMEMLKTAQEKQALTQDGVSKSTELSLALQKIESPLSFKAQTSAKPQVFTTRVAKSETEGARGATYRSKLSEVLLSVKKSEEIFDQLYFLTLQENHSENRESLNFREIFLELNCLHNVTFSLNESLTLICSMMQEMCSSLKTASELRKQRQRFRRESINELGNLESKVRNSNSRMSSNSAEQSTKDKDSSNFGQSNKSPETLNETSYSFDEKDEVCGNPKLSLKVFEPDRPKKKTQTEKNDTAASQNLSSNKESYRNEPMYMTSMSELSPIIIDGPTLTGPSNFLFTCSSIKDITEDITSTISNLHFKKSIDDFRTESSDRAKFEEKTVSFAPTHYADGERRQSEHFPYNNLYLNSCTAFDEEPQDQPQSPKFTIDTNFNAEDIFSPTGKKSLIEFPNLTLTSDSKTNSNQAEGAEPNKIESGHHPIEARDDASDFFPNLDSDSNALDQRNDSDSNHRNESQRYSYSLHFSDLTQENCFSISKKIRSENYYPSTDSTKMMTLNRCRSF